VTRRIRLLLRYFVLLICFASVSEDLSPKGRHIIATAVGTNSTKVATTILITLWLVYLLVSCWTATGEAYRVYGRTLKNKDVFDEVFDNVRGYEIDWYTPLIVIISFLSLAYVLKLPNGAWLPRVGIFSVGLLVDYLATRILWRAAHRIVEGK
jgi:hypothetical protein